jgi:predicted Holliday junction resolvase-like endonuclease
MYEFGKLVGEKRATDKFPEAKKAAVQRSRSVLGGMFAEQLAPYLPDFPFSPTEAKFIGAPIDFLVFRGMDAQHIEEVIFVEVKSGSSRLNHNEHSLKEAIENNRVRWHTYRVPPLSPIPAPHPNPPYDTGESDTTPLAAILTKLDSRPQQVYV